MVIFQFPPRKHVIQTWLCNCPQYPCLFHHCLWVHPRSSWSIKDVGSPKKLLYWVVSTSDQCFVAFQPIWCHPHTHTRITLFHIVQNKHAQLETFSHPCFNRTFSNFLSHNSPAKGWPYRFRSRGTTGSSILDHDLGHLCRGGRIQMSGHSDLGIFSIFGASSIFTWVLAEMRPLLVLRNPAVWRWYPWPLLLSFGMLMILVQWILHRIQNHLSQYHLGIQLDLCNFLVLCLQFGILQMTDVHQWGKTNFCALRPCFVDRLFLTSDFRQVPRRNLVQSLPFLTHCCLCCGNFHGLRHRNKFVHQNVMLQWIDSFFPAIWSSWWFGKDSSIRSLVDSLVFQKTRKFWLEIITLSTGLPFLTFLVCLAKHSGNHWRFRFLASILDGLVEFLVLKSMK